MTPSRSFPLEAVWPAVLKDLGVRPRTVLRRAELPEDLFSRQGVSLSTPDYFRFWTALEHEVGDPAFPLRLGQAFRPETFHPPIFAALCSSELAVAVQRIAQYKRLIAPMRLHVEEDDESLALELDWLDRTVQAPVSLVTAELVFFVHLARVATREHVRPLRVQTPRPPKPAAEYTRYFGVRVQRGETHAVTFSAADAHLPFLTANEAVWRTFEPTLRQRLADLETSATVGDRIRAVLLEGLPGGESSMDDVSSKLAISKRTLQRRLRDEGTTFQAVLNATREDLARYYLANTSLGGAEISYLLGFEDPNSFFRAFHSWTGETTEQIRLAHPR